MADAYERQEFSTDSNILTTVGNINSNEVNAKAWADEHITSTSAHSIATQTANGFMSSEDKIILDGASSSANANGIVRRDSEGRAKIVTPNEDTDIANKKYVDDAVSTNLCFKKTTIIGTKSDLTWTFKLTDVQKEACLFSKVKVNGTIVVNKDTSKSQNDSIRLEFDPLYEYSIIIYSVRTSETTSGANTKTIDVTGSYRYSGNLSIEPYVKFVDMASNEQLSVTSTNLTVTLDLYYVDLEV